MPDQLSFDIALKLAGSLKSIRGFSFDEAVIQATAEDLCRWCRGAILDRIVWPAEEQAYWLVTEARETWEQWPGTAAFRALLRDKFEQGQPVKQEAPHLSFDEVVARGLVRPPCERCDDSGVVGKAPAAQFCTCSVGRHQRDWDGERGLQRINQVWKPRAARPSINLDEFLRRGQMLFEDEQRRKREQLSEVGMD